MGDSNRIRGGDIIIWREATDHRRALNGCSSDTGSPLRVLSRRVERAHAQANPRIVLSSSASNPPTWKLVVAAHDGEASNGVFAFLRGGEASSGACILMLCGAQGGHH